MSEQPTQRSVRVALVGAGIFMHDAHVPSILRLGRAFEIAAIYSRSVENARQLARKVPYSVEATDDLSALLSRADIEAVIIAVPIPNLPDVVVQAMAAGKHILSEKPIAPDVESGRRLLAQFSDHPDTTWVVGENWRYEEAFLRAGKIVRSGEIGDPITCHWALHAPVDSSSKYYHSQWRRNSRFPGGYLLDGGVHHIAALRLVMGEIDEVSATTTHRSPDLSAADTLAATLRFENGSLGTYTVSYAGRATWPPYMHVVGTRGTIRAQRRELEVTTGDETQRIECSGFDGVEKEVADFARSIRLGTAVRGCPEEGLQDVAVIEAMLRSADSGRTEQVTRFV